MASKSFNPDKAEEFLRSFVTAESWESMSRKEARHKLEEKFGLSEDALLGEKDKINDILQKIVSELQQSEETHGIADGCTSASEEHEGEAENPTKKRKAGAEPPKNLKKLQAMMMGRAMFLDKAPILSSRIGEDLVFDMKPRTFSSGSCGWFHGGKVAIKVGNKNVWCQLGVNCTVLGSKEWDD